MMFETLLPAIFGISFAVICPVISTTYGILALVPAAPFIERQLTLGILLTASSISGASAIVFGIFGVGLGYTFENIYLVFKKPSGSGSGSEKTK